MRVLVTGDREWRDYEFIVNVLKALPTGTVIIEGCQVTKSIKGTSHDYGADHLAEKAATLLGFTIEHYPANWKVYGKGAGPLRNRSMYARSSPEIVYAFHDHIEKSTGTADMIKVARVGKTEVRLFSHNQPAGIVL